MHLNLEKTEHTPCNSLDTCKIRHLYRKHTRFRCFNGAKGKCAAESTPDGVWQKWLRKSQMHLNPEAGRHKRGKTLSKRMLQRLRQEWPRFRCCQNPVHLNLEKIEDTPCNSLDTCKIRHLDRKHTRFRCFIGAIGTKGKYAVESAPDGVWQKWLRKSQMHLNPEAGRRERGKTLSKRMLQRLRQEWPAFRCCQNPVHLNLEKTEHTPCNSLDTCKIRHPYRKRTRFRCFIGAIGTKGKCAAESAPYGVWQKWLRKSQMHLNAGAGRRERSKTLNIRMLQRSKQEWPRFRCQ